MPLPEGGKTPWPPTECDTINKRLAVWDAWHSGDPQHLAAVYSGNGGGGHEFFASEQGGRRGWFGAAVDRVKRWFWGESRTRQNSRMRVHVPLAKQIAKVSAGLLFSEPPTFTVEDQAVQERLNELTDDGLHATLLEGAQRCAALGGVYLAVVWDRDVVADRPWLTAIHPDSAVGEFSYGRLTAVTYWRVISSSKARRVRHLERHEPGRILHAVYDGTEDHLGTPVPLTDYPETKGIAQYVNADQAIETGYPGLTSEYVPNMLPSPFEGTYGVNFGASDYDGTETLLDALDMAASSLTRDVDLGKARIIVPAEYLMKNGPGQGASADLDREVYEPINTLDEGKGITFVQAQIRVGEHTAVMDAMKREIVGTAGYSGRGFGLDEAASAVTATEVNSLDRRDAITRDHKARYWGPALASILEAMLHIDRKFFPRVAAPVEGEAAPEPVPPGVIERPTVEWPDAVSVDPEAQARTLSLLEQARAISTETKVRQLHPDWDDTQVEEEVARILDEQGMGEVADPDQFQAPPDGPPDGEFAEEDPAADEEDAVPPEEV